jgi:acyl carrier protein
VQIKETLLHHIHDTYLNGEQVSSLKYDTPLLTSGIIDSIGVVELIGFIEKKFAIDFMPRELDRDRLETIDRIDEAIRKKLEIKRRR